MYMEIKLSDLMSFVKTAVEAGVQSYVSSVTPEANSVNRVQAQRHLSAMGYRPAMLAKWEAAGLIHSHKSGEGRTCRVRYSLEEIKRAAATMRLKEICNIADK